MKRDIKVKLNQEQAGILIAVAGMVFGTWLRLYPILLTDFPINDGGLFYQMTLGILDHGFKLPWTISYNGLNIPFAYPPFAFYVAAFLTRLFHVSTLSIFRWLPAVILCGTLPAFYLLAKAMIGSSLKAGVATFLFAFTPQAITWFIMGGGLTRSFGQLFLILTLFSAHEMFQKCSRGSIALTILFGSLVVLSHPEATLHTIAGAMLLWFFFARDRRGVLSAVTVALGIAIVTSPWWITVFQRYGIEPFRSASQTGFTLAHAAIHLITVNNEEPFATFITVFAIIGLFLEIAKRDFLFPAWLALIFLVEPRNAPNVATIPIAMLGSLCLTDIILPALSNFENRFKTSSLRSSANAVFLVTIGAYLLIGMLYSDLQYSTNSLSDANRQAFDWVGKNTPPDSRFLIFTGQPNLFVDWTQEWFPVLTGRVSSATIQGTEWLGGDFIKRAKQLQLLQLCSLSNEPLNCVMESAQSLSLEFDYVYIARLVTETASQDFPIQGDALIADLNQTQDFSLIYKTTDVLIYQKQHQP